MPSIRLSVNEKTVLRFAGLGTAGYMWKCTADDPTKIQVDRRLDDAPLQSDAAGASRDELFTITALKQGTVQADFIQYRHWEPESAAIKKVVYTIEIT